MHRDGFPAKDGRIEAGDYPRLRRKPRSIATPPAKAAMLDGSGTAVATAVTPAGAVLVEVCTSEIERLLSIGTLIRDTESGALVAMSGLPSSLSRIATENWSGETPGEFRVTETSNWMSAVEALKPWVYKLPAGHALMAEAPEQMLTAMRQALG